MAVTHRCWAEVDLDALRENLAWLQHRVGPGVRTLTVVKADAYGHGLKQIAALLMQSGTDIFGVANLAEAHAIRSVGRGWPILMLGACLPHEFEPAVRDGVRMTVSTAAELTALSRAAKKLKTRAIAHLKVDTGMGRLGASPAEVPKLLRKFQGAPLVQLEGLFTHFASAEDDAAFTSTQRQRFTAVLAAARKSKFNIPTLHACNSAALLHEPEMHFNLVRPGLLVYGIVPPGRRPLPSKLHQSLRPALSWHARVALVKSISARTPLSYGGSFIAPKAMRVATLTAGYGDGYLRAASNRAQVLIRGRRCRVLGRVTMDQIIVDVSHLPLIKPGEQVTLIGRQGHDEITVADLAAWCQTIPWEVLTNITYRVPRLYRGGRAA